MDNRKTDSYYLEKMISDLRFIVRYTGALSPKEFDGDELLQNAMAFRMIQLSENAGRLTPEYKAARPEIPWGDIAGLRNRIVHDYGNVNLHIVYETLTEDIPQLLKLLTDGV